MNKFEITFREILVSVIILLLMIAFGFFISANIQDHYADKNQKYFKSLKVKDEEVFNYAINTSIGNMMAYGKFKANNAVTYEDVKGEYFSVSKTMEKYTEHSRRVSYKCGERRCHRTEKYWTWDFISKDSKHTDTFKFLNKEFRYDLLSFSGEKHIKTDTFGHIRYIYRGIPTDFNGTWFSKTTGSKMLDNELYVNEKIEKVLKDKESQSDTVATVFWVIWSLITLVIVVIFIYKDNKILNKNYK